MIEVCLRREIAKQGYNHKRIIMEREMSCRTAEFRTKSEYAKGKKRKKRFWGGGDAGGLKERE